MWYENSYVQLCFQLFPRDVRDKLTISQRYKPLSLWVEVIYLSINSWILEKRKKKSCTHNTMGEYDSKK